MVVEHVADEAAESEESSKEGKVEEIVPKRRLTGKQKSPAKENKQLQRAQQRALQRALHRALLRKLHSAQCNRTR